MQLRLAAEAKGGAGPGRRSRVTPGANMDHALSPHACTEAPRRDDERDCEVGTPDEGAGRAAAEAEAAEAAEVAGGAR